MGRTGDFAETDDSQIQELRHRFGSDQNLEGHKSKGKLLDIVHQAYGSGSADSRQALGIHYPLVAYLTLIGTAASKAELKDLELDLIESYPDYADANMWLQDQRQTYEQGQLLRNNPFVERA